MNSPTQTNVDGCTTTTLAQPGTSTEGLVVDDMDGQMLTTTALNERSLVDDGQPDKMITGEIMDIVNVDLTAMDEQLIAVEGTSMLVDVDPLACPLSASFVSMDEAVLSPSPGTPVKSVLRTPQTPRGEFLSMAESSPDASVPGRGMNVEQKTSADVGLKKRVVGRKLPVVDDEDESQSPRSDTSTNEEILATASSSRTGKRGIKRVRKVEKKKDQRSEKREKEESSEEIIGKRKGRQKVVEKKDPPEKEDSDGKYGETKGVVEHVFEDMSSSVLGGAIMEWASKIDEIRIKSKNLNGKLSGDIKKCVTKIKEGTTLLIIRSEATGDPHFLRMRNSELATQLREAEREIARLEEQLRRSSGTPSPLRKRRVAKLGVSVDIPSCGDTTGPVTQEEVKALPSSIGGAFPPLPQRTPRSVVIKSGADRVPPVQRASSVAMGGSESPETATEAYYTQQIKALVAARALERDRKRKEDLGREQRRAPMERENRVGKDVDKGKGTQDGNRKMGPRVISDVRVVPAFKERAVQGDAGPVPSGSDTEWRLVSGGRHKWKNKPPLPSPLPPLGNKGRPSPAVLRGTGSGETSGVEWRPPLGQQARIRPPKTPLSSAVTITGKAAGFSYAAALKSAREHIDLEALGIKTTRVRKAINGGLLIEVAGEDSKSKAKELVTRLQGVLKDSAVISCPIKKRELRVIGFDESVSSDEIVEALCSLGDCSKVDTKIGPIRTMNNGLGMAWVQLPVAAAAKVVEEGRIRLG